MLEWIIAFLLASKRLLTMRTLTNFILLKHVRLFILLFVIGTILIAVGRALYTLNQPRDFPETWSTFAHNEYGYKIDYPENWRIIDFPNGNRGDLDAIGVIRENIRCFGCVRFGDLGPSIYIAHRSFEEPTLEQALVWGEERIIDNSGNKYTLKNTEISSIDNFPTVFRTYTRHDSLSNELEPAIDAYILTEEAIFLFTLDVAPLDYDEIYPIFEQLVNSFHFSRLDEN